MAKTSQILVSQASGNIQVQWHNWNCTLLKFTVLQNECRVDAAELDIKDISNLF